MRYPKTVRYKRSKGEEFVSEWGAGKVFATPMGEIFFALSGGEIARRKTFLNDGGYEIFSYSYLGFSYQCSVHRFVWRFFNGPIPDKMQIHHVDHQRAHNDLENLRLVTASENNRMRSPWVKQKPLFKALKRVNRTGRMP